MAHSVEQLSPWLARHSTAFDLLMRAVYEENNALRFAAISFVYIGTFDILSTLPVLRRAILRNTIMNLVENDEPAIVQSSIAADQVKAQLNRCFYFIVRAMICHMDHTSMPSVINDNFLQKAIDELTVIENNPMLWRIVDSVFKVVDEWHEREKPSDFILLDVDLETNTIFEKPDYGVSSYTYEAGIPLKFSSFYSMLIARRFGASCDNSNWVIHDESYPLLVRALELDRTNHFVSHALSRYHASKGQYRRSCEYAHDVLRRTPTDHPLYITYLYERFEMDLKVSLMDSVRQPGPRAKRTKEMVEMFLNKGREAEKKAIIVSIPAKDRLQKALDLANLVLAEWKAENQSCWVCGKKGSLKKCSKCHIAHYCSKECQNADWEEHKRYECKNNN
jgi:hypothetical protein